MSLFILIPCGAHSNDPATAGGSLLTMLDELRDLRATVVAAPVEGSEPGQGVVEWNRRFRISLSADDDGHSSIVWRRPDSPTTKEVLETAHRLRADLLIVDPGSTFTPGSIRAMLLTLGADPMIGFVVPRSNRQGRWTAALLNADSESKGASLMSSARELLPPWQFIPSADGAAVLIASVVIAEIGLASPDISGPGFGLEELSLRANRYGFRTALCNHALVLAPENGGTERGSRPESELAEQFSEFRHIECTYERTVESALEPHLPRLLTAVGRPLDLVIDLTHLREVHNGTSECLKKIIGSILIDPRALRVTLLCDPGPASFHKLGELFPGTPVIASGTTERFDIVLRVGFPYRFEEVVMLTRLAWTTVYMVLDAIAWDCAYIRTEKLDAVWRAAVAGADGLIANSEFTRSLFNRRFESALRLPQLTCPHSLSADDYLPTEPIETDTAGGEEYVLVVGNSYDHKFLRPTLERIVPALPGLRFRVLGLDSYDHPSVTVYRSGGLSERQITGLYAGASIVVFPSMYEGFGFPIAHGMALGKKVLARKSELSLEFQRGWSGQGELVLYETTDDLLSQLHLTRIDSNGAVNTPGRSWLEKERWDWKASGAAMVEFLIQTANHPDAARRLRSRLESNQQLEHLLDIAGKAAVPGIASGALVRLKAKLKKHPGLRRVLRKAFSKKR